MNSIKFLGTAGARFVVMKQLRASGGLWLNLDDTNVLIDPGPGSLLQCLKSKPRLEPQKLDGIILTHRHLDHANDINVIIEAMTNGGFDRRGIVFTPQDGLSDDPVIFQYVRKYVERIEILKEKGIYTIGNISFSTPIKHIHGVETYGLNIQGKHTSISLITDTQYFNELPSYYGGNVLIVNVVLFEEKEGVQHLCISDVEKILHLCKPVVCILTHFGTNIIKNKPWEIAAHLSQNTGVSVVAARDGMQIDLDAYSNK